jgi:prepilin-type N-terminal cleavage/methylation domain-containing protein
MRRGFTLIELLVVTGIMALISGLVLVNNNKFGGAVLLQNLAYDMALSIRQAQIYGISVQRFNTSFGAAYGMHFDANSGSGNASYELFADALLPANGTYECPQPGTVNCELVQSTTLSRGFTIQSLCATPPGQTEVCGVETLDITFERPEPDAFIRAPSYAGLNESARIRVSSPRGDVKDITVEANGQISVR